MDLQVRIVATPIIHPKRQPREKDTEALERTADVRPAPVAKKKESHHGTTSGFRGCGGKSEVPHATRQLCDWRTGGFALERVFQRP